jgi:hypothetical protein
MANSRNPSGKNRSTVGEQGGQTELSTTQRRKLTTFRERLDRCGMRDLRLRHELGCWLLREFGDSKTRQKRNEEIFQRAADVLDIGLSTVYRLRDFAVRFKSPELLKRQHPNVTCWTQVRDLVPRLKREGNGTPETKAGDRKVERILRSVKRITAEMRKLLKKEAPKKQQSRLLEAIQQFLKSIPTWMGLKRQGKVSV